MNKGIGVDPRSLASLQIEMLCKGKLLGHATASIWFRNGKAFLVTNWHNLTGKHRDTNKHLNGQTLAEPDAIRIYYNYAHGAGKFLVDEKQLYGLLGEPKFFEHPEEEAKIDLVALPVEVPNDARVVYVNQLRTTELITVVGSELFVVGFPFKTDVVTLPVWKRASMASEPELPLITGVPRFLVDTATRQGMSGSLVFRQESGAWINPQGKMTYAPDGNPVSQLLGVYSGRLGGNKHSDAQLGIVWNTECVNELLKSIPIPA